MDKSLLGPKSPWTTVPWTFVPLDQGLLGQLSLGQMWQHLLKALVFRISTHSIYVKLRIKVLGLITFSKKEFFSSKMLDNNYSNHNLFDKHFWTGNMKFVNRLPYQQYKCENNPSLTFAEEIFQSYGVWHWLSNKSCFSNDCLYKINIVGFWGIF